MANYDSNPITFDLINLSNNQPVIFQSTLNQINITLTNNTTGPVQITGGAAAYDIADYATNNWTCIYLQFAGVFSNEDVQSMTLSMDGWNPGQFTDDGVLVLALAPPEGTSISLPSGGQLTFSLNGAKPTSGSAGGATITFAYANIGGAGMNPGTDSIQIQIASASDAPNLPLQAAFQGLGVVTIGSEPTNTLQFAVINPMQTAVVPGGGASWGEATPTFTFSFVEGTDAGALSDQISSAALNVTDDQGNGWPNPSQNGSASWQLLVNSTPGYVIGTGDSSFVTLELSNLEVDALPGLTSMMITWSSIPGYSDGQIILPIVKVEPTSIDYFTVTIGGTAYQFTPTSSPSPLPIINQPAGPTDITFSYSANNCTFVIISNTAYSTLVVGGNSTVSDIPATIEYSTTYTFTAINYITGQQASLSIPVTVTPNLFALFPKQTIIMWSGDPNNPPAGWQLCTGGTMPDGVTPIPDLQDRFIVGIGPVLSNNQIGQTGGTISHSHSVSVAAGSLMEGSSTVDGSHAHTITFNTTMKVASGSSSHYMVMYGNSQTSSYASSTADAQYSENTDNDGVHGHTIPPSDANFPTSSVSALPPWYSLAFIIKVF